MLIAHIDSDIRLLVNHDGVGEFRIMKKGETCFILSSQRRFIPASTVALNDSRLLTEMGDVGYACLLDKEISWSDEQVSWTT